MAEKRTKKIYYLCMGFLAGLLNGLFGGGGGMVAVPLLRRSGLSQQAANATSLFLMLPLSVITLIFTLQRSGLPDFSLWPLMAVALPSSALGALLLPKLNAPFLRRLFGFLLTAAAIRLFF